jgi:hypothetical protein
MEDWMKNWLLVGLSLYWFSIAFLKQKENQSWKWSLFFVVFWPLAIASGFVEGFKNRTKKK